MRIKMKNTKTIRKPQVKRTFGAAAERDSRQALLTMMKMKVGEFYGIQNHDDPIMAELLRQSLAGNLTAAKRVTDIVEGKI
jgi:hypothetical protein